MPDAAYDLLKAEFSAVETEALEALRAATAGKAPAEFVQTCLAKIAGLRCPGEDDCAGANAAFRSRSQRQIRSREEAQQEPESGNGSGHQSEPSPN